MMDELARLTESLLLVLALVGTAAALVTVLALVIAALRSIWSVTARRAILVVAFGGSERSQHVAGVLAQRLVDIEKEWILLSKSIAADEESLAGKEGALVGPATRTLSDALAWFDVEREKWILKGPDGERAGERREVVAEEPLDHEMIGTVTFGGVGFSPEAVLTLLHKLRATAARQRIAGTLYEFGATAHLDASLRIAGDTQRVTCVRQLAETDELFDALDDLAFELVKSRLAITASIDGFGTYARTWKGYRCFLTAHDSHLRFLRTGRAFDRDDAIEGYGTAIDSEPGYWLPHYNLGTLLYNRYTPKDNEQAIERFRDAAQSRSPRVRALALAGLAMAYSQNVHRFGEPKEPWAFWAEVESARALELEPDIEETRFARGWAYQVLGRMNEAVAWYDRVAQLPEDTVKTRQLKSFALCNAGFVCLCHLDDEERAVKYLCKALELYRNKIAHANLAEVHKRRREFEAAEREFKSAISLDPQYVNALNELGMLYVAWAHEASDGRHGVATRDASEEDGPLNALLDKASSWHECAVVAVADRDARARLHEVFGEEYKRWGFDAEAKREFGEAEAARAAVRDPAGAP